MTDQSKILALWYDAPGSAVLREEPLHNRDCDQTVPSAVIGTKWSAISRGTERLVLSGKVPVTEYGRMRGPFQSGNFPFPVKYGYCAAGVVEEGPAGLVGKNVFALHPHQNRFEIPAANVTIVPDALPLRRATLAANMETALNALWDSGAGPGDKIIVIGAGIVGLLITWLAARLPGADVTAVDTQTGRADIITSFGAHYQSAESREQLKEGAGGADIVFHTTASRQGLASAIASAGFEGRIIELSWYGEGEVSVPLGGAFHSQRLQLVSSQVGNVAPSRRPRWSYGRRMEKALELLCDERLDALITDEFAFEDLPATLPQYLSGSSAGLAAVVRY